MDIFLNQLIQFYSHNATNLHHFTTHSTTVLTYKMAIVLRPQICDVISPYVYQMKASGHKTKIVRDLYTCWAGHPHGDSKSLIFLYTRVFASLNVRMSLTVEDLVSSEKGHLNSSLSFVCRQWRRSHWARVGTCPV